MEIQKALDGKRQNCLEQGLSRARLGRENLRLLAESSSQGLCFYTCGLVSIHSGLCEELRA